jgi:hypothetical protein
MAEAGCDFEAATSITARRPAAVWMRFLMVSRAAF